MHGGLPGGERHGVDPTVANQVYQRLGRSRVVGQGPAVDRDDHNLATRGGQGSGERLFVGAVYLEGDPSPTPGGCHVVHDLGEQLVGGRPGHFEVGPSGSAHRLGPPGQDLGGLERGTEVSAHVGPVHGLQPHVQPHPGLEHHGVWGLVDQ